MLGLVSASSTSHQPSAGCDPNQQGANTNSSEGTSTAVAGPSSTAKNKRRGSAGRPSNAESAGSNEGKRSRRHSARRTAETTTSPEASTSSINARRSCPSSGDNGRRQCAQYHQQQQQQQQEDTAVELVHVDEGWDTPMQPTASATTSTSSSSEQSPSSSTGAQCSPSTSSSSPATLMVVNVNSSATSTSSMVDEDEEDDLHQESVLVVDSVGSENALEPREMITAHSHVVTRNSGGKSSDCFVVCSCVVWQAHLVFWNGKKVSHFSSFVISTPIDVKILSLFSLTRKHRKIPIRISHTNQKLCICV